MKCYIGIDNGVSGSIGIISQDSRLLHFIPTPTFSTTSYTKSIARNRTRIDYPKLVELLSELWSTQKETVIASDTLIFKAFIERPMINPVRFQASISASASLEATLIALEEVGIGYEFCDSKGWQKLLLPAGLKGEELKKASLDVGVRMYPQVKGVHVDCDGLLIAEWARRMNL